ncbi:MAG: hypothetical protein HY751_12500 [Nitrospinae bacterium]|nr:hypothetical protein [Nitrospinota bacterium]
MSFINVKEVNAKIADLEAQLNVLRELLQIGVLLSGGRAEEKGSARGRGRKAGARRGSLSAAIITLVENSNRPLTSGEIKQAMVKQGLADPKSSSVYALLLQMAKRGTLKKAKTPDGVAYSAVAGAAPKKPGRPAGKKGKKRRGKLSKQEATGAATQA